AAGRRISGRLPGRPRRAAGRRSSVENSPLQRCAPVLRSGKRRPGRGWWAAACLLGGAAPAFAFYPQTPTLAASGGSGTAAPSAAPPIEVREVSPESRGVH